MMEFPEGVPPGLVTAEEVRAAATREGLDELCTLSPPPRSRIRDAYPCIPEAEWFEKIRDKKAQQADNRGLVKHTLQGAKAEKLNAFGLYRYVNGGRDGGSSLSDNITAAARYGIPSERVWPRSKGWRTPLSDEAKRDALRHRPDEVYRVSDRREFGTALLLGFVVYAGYPGHAWFAVDLVDTSRFYWKNSWGAGWGDNGVGTLRFGELQWGYGCWAVRTARMAAEVPDALEAAA
jgi:hypothetical protein